VSVLPFKERETMETTNRLITTPAAARSSSCHAAGQGLGSWLSRRRGLVFGGGVIVAATALALNQHWLTVAELTPLLFVLPCAVMMLMCVKGMNHGKQTGAAQASAGAETPISTVTRN
jgi:Protein of unknown function (DUF2933)